MRQVSLRSALRARAMNPVLLGASHARRAPPELPFAAGSGCSRGSPPPVLERQAVPGGGAVCGAEQRSLEGGERSELRQPTCRILFERSERSERSELCGTPSRRAGEPGHEQSSGLFVPGERPVLQDRRGLQGQGSLSAAKAATVSATAGHRLPRRADIDAQRTSANDGSGSTAGPRGRDRVALNLTVEVRPPEAAGHQYRVLASSRNPPPAGSG